MSFKKNLAQVNAFCSVQYLGLCVYYSGFPIYKSSSTSGCLSSSQHLTGKRETQRERERFMPCLKTVYSSFNWVNFWSSKHNLYRTHFLISVWKSANDASHIQEITVKDEFIEVSYRLWENEIWSLKHFEWWSWEQLMNLKKGVNSPETSSQCLGGSNTYLQKQLRKGIAKGDSIKLSEEFIYVAVWESQKYITKTLKIKNNKQKFEVL